jgi:hypothetical protein
VVVELIRRSGRRLHVARYVERLPLGTRYPHVARRVAAVVRGTYQRAARSAAPRETVTVDPTTGAGVVHRERVLPVIRLYVDATGLGQPVVDLLRAAGVRPQAVYFTHGDRRTVEQDGNIKLGKAWLVSRLQALLQTRRLLLPHTPEAEQLAQELLDYEIRIDQNANDTYGAFKVGRHDDLVTALGLAVQDDGGRPFTAVAGGERGSLWAAAETLRRNPGQPLPPKPWWR